MCGNVFYLNNVSCFIILSAYNRIDMQINEVLIKATGYVSKAKYWS